MIRFDYAGMRDNPGRRIISTIFGPRLRLSVGALGCSIAVVAAAWFFETDRLTRLDIEAATLHAQLREAAMVDARMQRLQDVLARLRAADAEIDAARRHAVASTNLVARIGNDLPARTWLTSFSVAPDGTVAIDGRSGRLAEIGTTLTALPGGRRTTTQLLSISASGRSRRVLDFTLSSKELR